MAMGASLNFQNFSQTRTSIFIHKNKEMTKNPPLQIGKEDSRGIVASQFQVDFAVHTVLDAKRR